MRNKWTWAVALWGVATGCLLAHAAEPERAALRSPWDVHPVLAKAGSYPCPDMPSLPKNIEASSYYSDAKHSVIDPVKQAGYNAMHKQFQTVTGAAEKAADLFQQTGNRAAAACVLRILDDEAAASAMTGTMSSNQAYYVQNWTIGALAVTWLKVHSAEPGTPQQMQAAIRWIRQVAEQTRNYFAARHAKGTNDGTNNHYYWAGFAAMGAAVSSDDPTLYAWARSTFDEAASRITADGMLPLELDRGQRALHYHLFALAPMVMLAEFGEANGDDLYGRNNHALQRLSERAIAGLKDNSLFAQKAGAAQDTPGPSGPDSSDVVWLIPYLRHVPNADAEKLLQTVVLKPFDYLGGYPPGWSYMPRDH